MFATRTENIYIKGCQLKSANGLTDELKMNVKFPDIMVTNYCECMENVFSVTNGKVRMALMDSSLIGISDISKPGDDFEAKCSLEALKKDQLVVNQ